MNNDWLNEFHEDLFKLFILASNDWNIYDVDEWSYSFRKLDEIHPFQFNDRAICEEEFEDDWFEGEIDDYTVILNYPFCQQVPGKIEWRYVENENE